ncbi:MAG: hypothetical protein AB2A00_38625 [Myxococcota bacterium]
MRGLLLMGLTTSCLTTSTPPPTPPPTPAADAGPFTPDDCKRSPDEATSVTVGSGAGVYMDIEDNTVMTWEKGPQGGHHIWVGVRMKGLRQSGTITELTVTDLENPAQQVILTRRRVPFTYDRDEGGYCVLKNLRVQLDEDVDIQTLQGHHVLIQVTLTDPDDSTAEAQRFVQVQGPVDNG